MTQMDFMTDLRHSDVPGLPGDLQRRVKTWALEVIARTGCRVYHNALRKTVMLCLRDPLAGVAAYDLMRDGALALPSVDQVCETVYSGRISKVMKDAMVEQSARERVSRERERVEKSIEDRRPDNIKSIQRTLRGRKSVSVSGIGASNV